MKKIKTALISVYHKEGLEPIIHFLNKNDVKIISTGGTRSYIEKLGVPVIPVESLTAYPSILQGRVKTLHPVIFGGILARRGFEPDEKESQQYHISPIDLVIVDLYPFLDGISNNLSEEEIIELIDIGGVSLIRAAAKNYSDVLIISHREQYPALVDLMEKQGMESNIDQRRNFAGQAFQYTSHYDAQIAGWFYGENQCIISGKEYPLRYGENPHQNAIYTGNMESCFDKISGKEISYNNLLDIDAAMNLMAEFDETTVAIIKHNNACGIASRNTLLQAWHDALAGDPVSAYGGIVITNAKVDKVTATEINKLFYEVLIAPDYEDEAIELLSQNKKRILLRSKPFRFHAKQVRSILNGYLVQDPDNHSENESDMKVVTHCKPDDQQLADMIFANKIAKHTKSNTIVLAKNKQMCASGTGQTSRVDALKQAIAKAESFSFDLKGAVMASDAFFPFADSVEIAGKAGIKAVIQPGGSIRDKDSIDYCNQHQISMVFTGFRHFKH